MNNLELTKLIIDHCESDLLLDPNIMDSLTKAERISYCLNRELGAYGINTQVSPDRASVYIDNQGMSQVLGFFEGKAFQPVLTTQQVERVQTLVESANQNKIDLIWLQTGLKKKYYLFKQYGFNGVNLYSLLNINTINSAGATLSTTGAVGLTLPTLVALSWSGGLFLSTLENIIPNNMNKTKAVVTTSKVIISLPIRLVELTSNSIIGFVENRTIGTQLPINVTDDFRLSSGPRLRDLSNLKKPIKKLFLYLADKL